MEKHKINLDRPEISSEEIKAKQNFDQIIKNYHVTPKSFLQKGWFWGTVGLASIAAVTVFTFTSLNSSEVEEGKEKQITSGNSESLPPDTPCIKPPKEENQQQFQIFKIDPKKENRLTTSEGSVITIPENAFKDADGNLIQNEIEIKIREFYTKEDLFLSGIPMTYDSSGTQYSLETGGMIELRGLSNGEEIKNLDKAMKIELATISADDNFNLYYLDENNSKWDYLKPLKSEEIALENLETPEVYKKKVQEIQNQIKETKIEIAQVEKTKPLKPRKLDESKFSFDIDANKSQFPELADFKNVIFEVGDENKGFSDEVYSKTWEDLQLKKLNNKYQVVLKKGSHIEKYIVYPALTGAEYTKAKSQFDKKFQVYDQKLNAKKVQLDQYQKDYEYNKKKWEQAVAYSQKKEYQHNELAGKYVNQSGISISKSNDKVTRIFEAKEFGVFNCDRKINFPSAQKVMALFIREDGSRIRNLHNVTLVSDKKNSIFQYSKQELARFGYNPRHENRIWMVDEKGDIYACGNDEFKKIDKKAGQHQFVMKKLPNFETVDEFKLLTLSTPVES